MEIQWFLNVLFVVENFIKIAEFHYDHKDCSFPERWEGFWFQSGVQNKILINGPSFSTKGRCVSSDGDKFLIADEKRTCYRCVVIHEKHINVLQYKETYCFNKQYPLSKICTSISGDASLYSMFRENAVPIPCPFSGSFSFTYNKGHGECKIPISSIDTCSSKHRLLFNYQACHDVHGTEATVEELECQATWKEGSLRFLIGKIYHSHAFTNEDRYRCFVYENRKLRPQSGTNDPVKIAQSGDATCNGLFSVSEGSKTLKLYKNLANKQTCDFPLWMNSRVEWNSLDFLWKYKFYSENSSVIITNSSGIQIDLYCYQILQGNAEHNYSLILARYVMGCQHGFVCINFLQRDKHVAEVQMGNYGRFAEDACSVETFDRFTLPHITLVSSKPETRRCSLSGKFLLNSLSNMESSPLISNQKSVHRKHLKRSEQLHIVNSRKSISNRIENHPQKDQICPNSEIANLIIGCNQYNIIEFFSTCSLNHLISSYSCNDQWQENETFYLITTPQSRSSHGAQRFCFIYREISKDIFLFSSSSLTCRQNFNDHEALVFNATKIGNCNEFNNSQKKSISNYVNLSVLILIEVAYLWIQR